MIKYNIFWRRLGAGIIDGLILWPLEFIEDFYYTQNNISLYILSTLIVIVLSFLYITILQGKYGQTIGKIIFQIKVFDINEINVIGFKRAVLRELPWFIINLLAIFYNIILFIRHPQNGIEYYLENLENIIGWTSIIWLSLELITLFFNVKRRALHDYLANSVVIRI